MLARHLSALALTGGLLAAFAVPASAQTRQADAVLLARTLADGLTAVDARRPQARATVDAWLADQGRCAKPHLRRRFRRTMFTSFRRQALHDVALRALAPELDQLAQRLRALPVTDRAIRGGVREVLLDYRNARELRQAEPASLCRVIRGLRGRGPLPDRLVGAEEDVRASGRAVARRASGFTPRSARCSASRSTRGSRARSTPCSNTRPPGCTGPAWRRANRWRHRSRSSPTPLGSRGCVPGRLRSPTPPSRSRAWAGMSSVTSRRRSRASPAATRRSAKPSTAAPAGCSIS